MPTQLASSTAVPDKPGQVTILKLRHVCDHPNQELLNPTFPWKVHKVLNASPVSRYTGRSEPSRPWQQGQLLSLHLTVAPTPLHLPGCHPPTPQDPIALAPHRHTGQEAAVDPENHNRRALSKNASSSCKVQRQILPPAKIWLLCSQLWESIKMPTGWMELLPKVWALACLRGSSRWQGAVD